MKIKVEIRNVYGKRLVYPACETAKLLCRLTGSKTLPWDKVQDVKELGYEIETITSEGGVL